MITPCASWGLVGGERERGRSAALRFIVCGTGFAVHQLRRRSCRSGRIDLSGGYVFAQLSMPSLDAARAP
jgi:hypothetical protein